MSIPWTDRASFIPYPRPVVPPTSDIQDAPLVSICVNADWLTYIQGCLKALARPETWNADQSSIDVAVENAMRIAFLVADGCGSADMFRQQDDCLLQRSVDSGVTWDTVFDASACVDALVKSGKYGQFGPSAPVTSAAPLNCRRMVITLYANSRFQWPELIDTDDVITIHDVAGVWSGTFNSFVDTHCGDGGFLDAFAQCGGSADPGHTGDPDDTFNHMRVVMELDGTWYDAYKTALTVPSGILGKVLTFQANDDVLLDNVGYVQMDIEVCKGTRACYFDFSGGSSQGWSIIPIGGLPDMTLQGDGYHASAQSGAMYGLIRLSPSPDIVVSAFEVICVSDVDENNSSQGLTLAVGDTNTGNHSTIIQHIVAGTHTYVFNGPWSTVHELDVYVQVAGPSSFVVKSVTACP